MPTNDHYLKLFAYNAGPKIYNYIISENLLPGSQALDNRALDIVFNELVLRAKTKWADLDKPQHHFDHETRISKLQDYRDVALMSMVIVGALYDVEIVEADVSTDKITFVLSRLPEAPHGFVGNEDSLHYIPENEPKSHSERPSFIQALHDSALVPHIDGCFITMPSDNLVDCLSFAREYFDRHTVERFKKSEVVFA